MCMIILLPIHRHADSLELPTQPSSHALELNLSQHSIWYALIFPKYVNTWSNSSIIRKSQYLVYLSQLLIRKSSDCHPNPGPRPPKYPCLSCQKAVKNNQNSVQCETCEQWCHADCLGMSTNRFDILTVLRGFAQNVIHKTLLNVARRTPQIYHPVHFISLQRPTSEVFQMPILAYTHCQMEPHVLHQDSTNR